MTEHDPLAGSDTYDVLSGLRPGEEPDRAYANDVADWCERELRKARVTGNLEARPFVQNAVLIIVALREYAAGLAGAVSQGSGSFRDIARDLPRNEPKMIDPNKPTLRMLDARLAGGERGVCLSVGVANSTACMPAFSMTAERARELGADLIRFAEKTMSENV